MTEQDDAEPGPNADQVAFWNSPAGEKWVRNQAEMDMTLAPLTEMLLARAAPAPGQRVLDVGCGTGTTVLQLAGAVGPGGHVQGLDVSEPMLALARQRVAAAGAGNVDLVLDDAQTFAFDAGSRDLVFSRFGVMFFADPPAAFANLRRALVPGGRLVFVCWADLADNPWFKVPRDAAIARLGPVPPTPRNR